MGREQNIERLRAVEDIAMEWETVTKLMGEYSNTSDYTKQDKIAEGLQRADKEKAAIAVADEHKAAKRKKIFLSINAAAILVSLVLFLVNRNIWTNSDTATLCVTWTMLLFIVGMLIELAHSGLCIIAYLVMILPVASGAASLGLYFLIPSALLLVSALVSAIVSDVDYSPEDKKAMENARLEDARIELANLAHIEKIEAMFAYRKEQFPILEKKQESLRVQIVSKFPDVDDMPWGINVIQKMIFALESGRADSIQEARDHAMQLYNMQFDARMKELQLRIDASVQKMRKQEILTQQKNSLYQAEQVDKMSAEELKNVRRKVEEARLRYDLNDK